jgi:hypothetical protein
VDPGDGVDPGDSVDPGLMPGVKQDDPLQTPHGPVELQQAVHFGKTGGTICVFSIYLSNTED